MADAGLNWTPGNFAVDVESRDDGSIVIRPRGTLADYWPRVSDALRHWAGIAPDRVFVARRDAAGDWQSLSYGDAFDRVRRIAAGLLPLELSADRPVLILTGNSIEHLLLGLAAMTIGVPYCPVSPAYCQPSSDLARLAYVIDMLTPGLVAAFGGDLADRAIREVVPVATPVIAPAAADLPQPQLSLDELANCSPDSADAANARTDPDTIVKFLLTSGSTGKPKPVITSNRMLCSNQRMLRQALPFVAEEPPVLVDWLPWNHTFGGSHNVGLVLFNGGSMYIDDGRPVTGLIGETLRNLTEIAPTVYFNVPQGFELLAREMQADDALRRMFFSRLRACFFAGAALSQRAWDELDALAVATCGRHVPILSGLGCTEMSPSVTFTTPSTQRAGVIGLPPAGCTIKLAPVAGKLELRADGPHKTPGYWRMPAATADAFDAEGYYRLGDAVRLVDADDPAAGMVFDGRISEDFKLASGTWVSTGPLRLSLLGALAPLALDVVIAGLNQDYVSVLIVPDTRACAQSVGAEELPAEQLLSSPKLRRRIAAALRGHAQRNRGTSRHAERAILLTEPLSVDLGEVTDKGSVNQRAVLTRRASLVDDLYSEPPPGHVIRLD